MIFSFSKPKFVKDINQYTVDIQRLYRISLYVYPFPYLGRVSCGCGCATRPAAVRCERLCFCEGGARPAAGTPDADRVVDLFLPIHELRKGVLLERTYIH